MRNAKEANRDILIELLITNVRFQAFKHKNLEGTVCIKILDVLQLYSKRNKTIDSRNSSKNIGSSPILFSIKELQ